MKKADDKAGLEEELQQNPKDIALVVFRFKARRGIGVFYALFSTLPLMQIILLSSSAPENISQFSNTIFLIIIWIIARLAGMQRFYQMKTAIDLFEGRTKSQNSQHKFARKVLCEVLVTPIIPLAIIAVLDIVGVNIVALVVLVIWLALSVYFTVLAYFKRSPDSIIRRRIEDWFIVLSLPIIVILSVFNLSSAVVLAVVAPIWLAAGIKSLYEAPQNLYGELGGTEDLAKEPTSPKRPDQNLSELAAAGVLSNSARVGILIALQGVERITFTDLMIALNISKSSLNKSIGILEEAGYVTVRKGFKATGRPRTFIQITPEGKDAVKTHLETMRRLTAKYLV